MNGLIYLKQDNRAAILKDYDLLMTLFDIFHCQLPIELHENALYALLNLFSDCSNKVKEFIMTLPLRKDLQKQGAQRQGILYLLKFLEDLFSLEYDVIRQPKGKFVVVDYGIKQNPLLEEAQLKEEKTIEEMQATVFDVKYYEYINEQKKMYYYPEPTQVKQPGFLVEGK